VPGSSKLSSNVKLSGVNGLADPRARDARINVSFEQLA
jgi:hypothetical protein